MVIDSKIVITANVYSCPVS